MKVGIIGVGNMGRAIAERLVETGHEVVLWNRTRATAEGIDGTTVVDTPAAVAAATDVVIDIVANDAALAVTYDGPGGLCSADLTGKTVVEMCTTSKETIQSLEPKILARGGLFLECPVGGTVGPARAGQLLGLAGGSPEAFAAAEPALRDITRRLEHLGPVGTGAAMKLSVNLPLMVYWGAVGEAIALAISNGIPPSLATDILADSSGAIASSKIRLPHLVKFIETGESGKAAFGLGNALKDMRLMEAALADVGAASSFIGAARQTAETAMESGGPGLDTTLYGVKGLSDGNA